MSLLALSVVHPAILGGLALASLPIIIHLLNRRRFKTMEWAAMEFLLKAAVRNRRRLRFENLLLLLLRTLVVILLILAVARPYSKRDDPLADLFGQSGTTERIFLLDDSHSMRAGIGNRSAFQRARDVVGGMVRRLREQQSADRITVVLGTDPRSPDTAFRRIAAGSAQGERLLDRLERLRPGHGSLDVAAAVDAILESETDEGTVRVLYVVSDMRRKDWTGPDGVIDPAIRAALRRFAESGRVSFIDVGSAPVQNAAVVDLRPRERAVIAGVPSTFVATVKNHGPAPVSDLQVEFRFGDHIEVPVKIERRLQPGEEAEVKKEFTFRTPGRHIVEARLPTDVLPGDDVRRLAVDARKHMRFLLIDGEPLQEAYRSETDYLAAALAAPGEVPSGIAVEVVEDRAFTGRGLDEVDGIFLCNVYRLPNDRIAAIEEFVRSGGGLVFFLGDQIDPAVYNAAFYGKGDRAGKGLLPTRLIDVEGSSEDYVHFAPPALDHPVVRFLRGINEIVLRTIAVQRYVSSEIPTGGEGRVIMTLTDEMRSPALVEKGLGEGRVLMFTTSADMEWTNFPLSPVFLAMLQETARYVVRPDPSDATSTVGEPLVVEFDTLRMQRRATLVPPAELGGAPVELRSEAGEEEGEERFFRYGRTNAAGVYLLRLKTPEGEEFTLRYAYNVDPAEGELRRADVGALADTVPGARVERPGEGGLGTDESDRTEFWRTLVYALVVAAGLETLLAWRFGHHGAKKLGKGGKRVFVR